MTIEENRGRAASWLLLSALVVLADQVSKAYIAGHYLEFEFIRILPVLDITCMHNVGAAFSFLASASGWQRWVFIGLAVTVSIGIATSTGTDTVSSMLRRADAALYAAKHAGRNCVRANVADVAGAYAPATNP